MGGVVAQGAEGVGPMGGVREGELLQVGEGEEWVHILRGVGRGGGGGGGGEKEGEGRRRERGKGRGEGGGEEGWEWRSGRGKGRRESSMLQFRARHMQTQLQDFPGE